MNRLMWLCAALFLLFGLPLAVVEDRDWQRVSGSLCLLALGGFALAMVADALATGRIRFQFSVIARAAQPRLFVAAVLVVAVAGAGVLASAVWAMFFKAW